MHHDHYKIRSSINPHLLQNLLLRGTLLGALAVFLLIFGGIFIPETLLAQVGLPLFFISFGSMTLGLLPYRKLKKLELRPHEIVICNQKEFLFAWEGTPSFTVPFASIEWLESVVTDSYYGIAIKIKSPCEEKIALLDGGFDLGKYVNKCRKSYSCDIFLPYFTQRGLQELKEFIETTDDRE